MTKAWPFHYGKGYGHNTTPSYCLAYYPDLPDFTKDTDYRYGIDRWQSEWLSRYKELEQNLINEGKIRNLPYKQLSEDERKQLNEARAQANHTHVCFVSVFKMDDQSYTMIRTTGLLTPSYFGENYQNKTLKNIPGIYDARTDERIETPDTNEYDNLVLMPEERIEQSSSGTKIENSGRGVHVLSGIVVKGTYLPKNMTKNDEVTDPSALVVGKFLRKHDSTEFYCELSDQEIQNIKNIGGKDFTKFYMDDGIERFNKGPLRVGPQEIDMDAMFPSLENRHRAKSNAHTTPNHNSKADTPTQNQSGQQSSTDTDTPASPSRSTSTKPDHTTSWVAMVGGAGLAAAGVLAGKEAEKNSTDKTKNAEEKSGWSFGKVASVAIGVTLVGWAAYQFATKGKGTITR